MSRGVRAGVLLIALGLAACATTPLAAPDRISVVYQSWGVVRERWSVARDGDGYSGARNQDTFPITAADFASVSELLEPARRFEGRDIPCRRIDATDLPHGSITWSRGGLDAVTTWNGGCVPRKNDMSLDNLDAAHQALLAMQARAHTPTPQ